MHRQIVLDTETTGIDPKKGHRIIEIGCVELVNRALTKNVFHMYLNPDRDIDAGALMVHGITREFLQDKPRFADVVEAFIEYLGDAEIIIHNAPFDTGFLAHEFALSGHNFGQLSEICKITDSLQLARTLHPGQKNSLDALQKRYEIKHIARHKHGALLDAQILAHVYLAMTGGQCRLFDEGAPAKKVQSSSMNKTMQTPKVVADEADLKAHREMMQLMRDTYQVDPCWDSE